MAATERVTVRMSRGDTATPWGFRLHGGQEFGNALAISKVSEGSLADRAGLLDSDRLIEIAGMQASSLRHQAAQDAIMRSGNNLDLVVERAVTNRIWKPAITPNDAPFADANAPPVKYSLAHDQHTRQEYNSPSTGSGFNAQSKPFQSQSQSQHHYSSSSTRTETSNNQYNSPSSLYNKPSSVDKYLQETGGLFGTDPKLSQPKPEPTYLKSETLRMIKESESRTGGGNQQQFNQGSSLNGRLEDGGRSPSLCQFQSKRFVQLLRDLADEDEPESDAPPPVSHVEPPKAPPPTSTDSFGAPACDSCGRHIQGVFCKASGKTFHGECFKCATCGGSLKNIGYFMINGKFYCEIHAQQQQQNQFQATPPVDPSIFSTYRPPPGTRRHVEPPKAFYQPEILKKGPITVHPPHTAPISPQERGIPTTHYSGNELNTTSNDYGSNYQYHKTTKKTTKTTTTTTTQQPESYSTTTTTYGPPTPVYQPEPPRSMAPPASAPPPPEMMSAPTSAPPPPPAPFGGDFRRSPAVFNNSNINDGGDNRSESRNYSSSHKRTETTTYTSNESDNNRDMVGYSGGTRSADGAPAPAPAPVSSLLLSSNRIDDNDGGGGGGGGDRIRKGVFWPPPVVNTVVPYWTVPSHRSDRFGPGASIADDYESHAIGDDPTANSRRRGHQHGPKRSVLLEDMQRQYEWRLEQQSLANDRATAALMLSGFRPPTFDPPKVGVNDSSDTNNNNNRNNNNMSNDNEGMGIYDTVDYGRGSSPPMTSLPSPCVRPVRCVELWNPTANDHWSSSDGHCPQPVLSTTDNRTSAAAGEQRRLTWRQPSSSHAGTGCLAADTDALAVVAAADLGRRQSQLQRKQRNENNNNNNNDDDDDQQQQHGDDDTEVIYGIPAKMKLRDSSPLLQETSRLLVDRTLASALRSLADQDQFVLQTSLLSDHGWQLQAGYGKSSKQRLYRHYFHSLDKRCSPKQLLDSCLGQISSASGDNNKFNSGINNNSNANFAGSRTTNATGAARRGRGILKQLQDAPRVPVCETCNREIRGPFVLAMGKSWCPEHFTCATQSCHRKLLDIGFVEENGKNYCEFCYEKYFAPVCSKCQRPVVGDCLTALDRQWHPDCFVCVRCHKPFGNSSFFLENGQAYCEADWNELFTTKCVACQFSIDAGDRWVEALGSAYHSDCFCCSVCNKNLEGQSFYAKGGRPYCKTHA